MHVPPREKALVVLMLALLALSPYLFRRFPEALPIVLYAASVCLVLAATAVVVQRHRSGSRLWTGGQTFVFVIPRFNDRVALRFGPVWKGLAPPFQKLGTSENPEDAVAAICKGMQWQHWGAGVTTLQHPFVVDWYGARLICYEMCLTDIQFRRLCSYRYFEALPESIAMSASSEVASITQFLLAKMQALSIQKIVHKPACDAMSRVNYFVFPRVIGPSPSRVGMAPHMANTD